MVSPFPIEQLAAILGVTPSVLLAFVVLSSIWTIILKGFALWFAAGSRQKGWFIALLIINTLGILEAVYLLYFRPKLARAMDS